MVCLNVKVSKATLDAHKHTHTHTYIHCVIIFEKLVGSYLKYMYVFNVRMHLKLCALPCHNESSKWVFSWSLSPAQWLTKYVSHSRLSGWTILLAGNYYSLCWWAALESDWELGTWTQCIFVCVCVFSSCTCRLTDWLTDWNESRVGPAQCPKWCPSRYYPKQLTCHLGSTHTHTHTLTHTHTETA